ncbi:MAG: leucyl aminopeptidase family protein [Saprospiraceae bacterium]|jgi:leucyl aminopeptidase|nr:leucyl aminopeptidase family protein [Saprospiraceae bacterium]
MHKINITSKITENHHWVIPIFENDLSHFDFKRWSGLSQPGEFKAEIGEINTLIHPAFEKKRWLLGLGKRNGAEQLIQPFRKVIHQNLKVDGKIVVKADHFTEEQLEVCMIGLLMSGYQLKSIKKEKQAVEAKIIEIYAPQVFSKKILQKSITIAKACFSAMDLVNMPPNYKTPLYVSEFAKLTGKAYQFDVKVIKGAALQKSKLHALYEVGKGSQHEPAFIIMEYKPAKKPAARIGLVGKGITFDTGGISLKNPSNMHYMKSDMAGAAAVIGVMQAAADLKLPIHLIGIVPAAENAVGSKAYRPGDIIHSHSGKTIEVIDTDAEGRLVLADGLSYMAKNFTPDYIIDLATLTGSCIATLGYTAAGLFTQNEELAGELYQSGRITGEKNWRLPLWDDYKPQMQSDMADIKNLSSLPIAGAITAAKFLEAFTDNHPAWAHLDIAGVSFTDSEYLKSRSATAYGVRLLTHWILGKC